MSEIENKNVEKIQNIQELLKDKELLLSSIEEEQNIDEDIIKEVVTNLNLLKDVEINKDILRITKIGITVNKLTKINNELVQNLSKDLVEKWKHIAKMEKMSSLKNNEMMKKRKSEKIEMANDKINNDNNNNNNNNDNNNDDNNNNENNNNNNNSDNNFSSNNNKLCEGEVEFKKARLNENGLHKCSSSESSNVPDYNIIKDNFNKIKKNDIKIVNEWNYDGKFHNDMHRDKAKQFLFKAFVVGSSDNLLYFIEKKKLNDIIYNIECELYKVYMEKKSSQKEYNMQLKSIKFNLSDKKNPNFNEKVYSEFISSKALATMNSQDMASDEKKNERKKCLQESLLACQSDWDVKNILLKKSRKGEFQCFKCKGYDTIYHQLQTRSSDEPMTTFVTCLKCNNRWKF
ncbi:transcription elongation factor s-II, putative [Plasmodium reichenowi]|uniref:Transcription elongation factor s-II, putative n=1 Tax=Plasmodium reichenowi TaxID=5854 RepID=A0A060RVM5_PLARE|nr:transcription elongation factor s-II, putative [Plasmodium reichenowi]